MDFVRSDGIKPATSKYVMLIGGKSDAKYIGNDWWSFQGTL